MVSKEVVRSILFKSLKIKNSESIFIIYDETKKDIVEDMKSYLNEFNIIESEMKIEVTGGHGTEAAENIEDYAYGYDIIMIFTKYSLSHTSRIIRLRNKGCRIISMPLITEKIMNRSVNIDYDEMQKLNKKVINLYEKSKLVRVISRNHELTIKVKNILNEDGNFSTAGMIANLPCGEVHCGIEHKYTFGKVVIDQAIAGIDKLLEPIILTIKNGRIINISGKNSNELMTLLGRYDEKGFILAEFGIGTNPKARIDTNPLELEKVKGTIHLGIGNDLIYGGANDIPIHVDAVTKHVEVFIGEQKILENGSMLI